MKKKIAVIVLAASFLLLLALMTSCTSSSGGDVEPPSMSDGSVEVNSGAFGSYDDLKMIKNASVSAETKDFDKMSKDLRALLKETGSVLYSSNVNDGISYRSDRGTAAYAHYTLKVPSEKLDDFIDSLKEIMNVTHVTTTTQNAGDEYYDLEASVKALENKYAGLSEMLKNTDKSLDFNTWLNISNELTSVEKELARQRAKLDALSKQVNYATLELSVTEIDKLTGEEEEEKPFGEEVTEAFKGSFEVFGEVLKALAIVAIYLLPLLIVIAVFSGIALLVVLLILRSVRKKKKAKTE